MTAHQSPKEGPALYAGGDFVASESPSSPAPGSLVRRIGGNDCLDLILRLTLVMTLLFASVRWYDRAVMQMLAACGLISPQLARRPIFWLCLAMAHLLLGNLHNWDISDNHQWLFTYWYLAIGLSLWRSVPEQTLGTNARLLIGLTFLFAVLRKVLSAEYMSGAAFRFLLQVDSRFFEPAKALAGHTQNPSSIWRAIGDLQPTIALAASPSLDRLATVLTWWTLAIEIAIGCAFLTSISRWTRAAGHTLLLVFVATTYPIAPVLGFAWILLIMGLAVGPAVVGPACRAGPHAPPDVANSIRSYTTMYLAYLLAIIVTFALQGERLKITLLEWWFGREFFQLGA